MSYDSQLEATVVISGTLVYRDAKGEVVGTADFKTALTPEQVAAMDEMSEEKHE